ncbi:MAG TPA: protease inhibitor I42 family protein [Casimicrobiaceae bacterium]|jgi:inhibitor of cysteine peptidase
MPRVLRLSGVLVLLTIAGCQSFPTWDDPFKAPPLAVRVDERNANAPITVLRNQTLVVTLEANVTTGYRWEAVPGFTPVLAQIGTADYAARSTDAPLAGSPGDMTFRFRGESPGTTALELAYRRPFEPNVAPAKTVRYDVTVR